jgi:hypothetical protein
MVINMKPKGIVQLSISEVSLQSDKLKL